MLTNKSFQDKIDKRLTGKTQADLDEDPETQSAQLAHM